MRFWTLLVGLSAAAARAPPTTILTIVIDDLGHYDTAVLNPDAPTPTLKGLADGGIRLGRHCKWDGSHVLAPLPPTCRHNSDAILTNLPAPTPPQTRTSTAPRRGAPSSPAACPST